ncbi:MAG: hypothetical protein H6581_05420 [Bacteroidia bacterium]|nr:hypothetical protein [Bacteroidia bacterium]
MNYEIILSKSITAKRFGVQGTVASPTKRSSLIPVLMLAAELEEEGKNLTALALRANLLSNLSIVASKNILDRLTRLGLFYKLDSNGYFQLGTIEIGDAYVLTEMGKEAANQQEIWENQYGSWEILVVNHPYFPMSIIELIPSKFAKEEDKEDSENSSRQNSGSSPLPRLVLEQVEKNQELSKGRKRIENLESKCQTYPDQPLILKVKVSSKGVIAQLFQSENELISNPLLDISPNEAITELLNIASNGNYDSVNNQVRTHFDPNNLSLERSIEIYRPKLGKESFENTLVPRVPHFPKSREDAIQWHYHLLCKTPIEWFSSPTAFNKHERTFAAIFAPEFEILPVSLESAVEFNRQLNTQFYDRMNFETLNDLAYS